jgi:hypothetical protein
MHRWDKEKVEEPDKSLLSKKSISKFQDFCPENLDDGVGTN